MASNAQVFRASIELIAQQTDKSVSEVLQAAADMHENPEDRVHPDMEGISYAQMNAVFSQTGLSDEEVRGISQATIDSAYNVHDGDVENALARITGGTDPRFAPLNDEGRTLTEPTVPETTAPETTAAEATATEPEAAAPEVTETEPEAAPTTESNLTRDSLVAITEHEGFPPTVRESAQAILTIADMEHAGDVDLAVAALRQEENTPVMDAVLNGEVTITTEPLLDREGFAQLHASMAEAEIDPALEAQNAERRAGLEEIINSEFVPPAVEVVYRNLINYADAEHDGSLNQAMAALGDMDADQAYETLNLNNVTTTMTSMPGTLDTERPQSELEQPAVEGASGDAAPEIQQPEVEGASLGIPDSGTTLAEISASLNSIPAHMVTRENLEGIAESGIPEWTARIVGMTSQEAQTMAQEALAITDARFGGDLNAAVAFLNENVSNPEYANMTVAQLNTAMQQQTNDVEEPTATAGAAPTTTTPTATSAPTQTAAATAADPQEEARKAQMRQDLSQMFNNMGMSEVASALDSNNPMQFITAMISALTGQTFSLSNDGTAFAGVQTPQGTSFPSGSQIDPATGNIVPNAGEVEVAASTTEPPRYQTGAAVPA